MNIFRQNNKTVYGRWVTAITMVAALGVVTADDKRPVSLEPVSVPKAVGESLSGVDTKYDVLVTEALAGNAGSVATLRLAGLEADDRQALVILARIRGSGVGRQSAIASCFIHHHDAWVKRTAIDTIAALGIDSLQTLNLLVTSLEDPSPMVAQASAAALSQLRDPRSWSRLIELMGSKDSQIVRLAHESLQHQTSQSFHCDQGVWEIWLKQRIVEEETSFSRYQSMLNDTQSGDSIVTAIDGMASLVMLRDQASTVLISFAHHSNLTVRDHVDRHLRQWTGTSGGDSLNLVINQAELRAVAPPPLTTLATVTVPVVNVTPQPSVSAHGLFESAYGMLFIVTIGSASLAILLWFLRTPAGSLVQNATKRFTKKIANSRIAVIILSGTKQFVKKIPAPVKVVTKRFAAPAKILMNRLATETQRMLKPNAKSK